MKLNSIRLNAFWHFVRKTFSFSSEFTFLKYILLFFAFAVINSCSDDISPLKEEKTTEIKPFRKTFPRKGVVKAKFDQGFYLVLLEKLSALEQIPGERSLELLDTEGNSIPVSVNTNNALIDADFDKKNIYTASIASNSNNESIIIEKFDTTGNILRSSVLLNETHNSYVLDDRIRIVASEENIYVGVYKEDETTSLYALDANTLATKWSLLVEPNVHRLAWGMIGGSYDCFGQLALPYSLFLDKDDQGNAYVAIIVMGGLHGSTLNHHNNYFGESLIQKSEQPGNPIYPTDALITKVSPDGTRLYSTVMGTKYLDEIHGMKVYKDKIVCYGRCAITSLNDWDPFIAVHEINTGNELYVKNYDLGSNEMFLCSGLDTVSGDFYFGGTGGWSQNPDGASISEQSGKIMLLADGESGAIEKTIPLENGQRQNQVSSIQILGSGLTLIAGWENGPGTHSGDGNSELVYADGFIEVK